MNSSIKFASLILLTGFVASVALAGDAKYVQIDGSSTVYPITEAVAEEFQIDNGGTTRVTVGVSGTGGGFKKLCRGELDIANASRPIQAAEMKVCADAGIRYYEIPVAFDAITVVVNPKNAFLKSITMEELKKIWQPEAQGKIKTWKQVNAAWPDTPISLYGPGADSGTFDYFTEAVTGKAKASRGDYTASEDDNILVQGAAQDVGGLAYFGYAYYAENKTRVKAVAIGTTAANAQLPTEQSIIDGSYQPLSRPLFIYVSEKAYQRPEIQDFINFYLDNIAELAAEVKYVALPQAAYATARQHIKDKKLGTVFKGSMEPGITIEELLRREASL